MGTLWWSDLSCASSWGPLETDGGGTLWFVGATFPKTGDIDRKGRTGRFFRNFSNGGNGLRDMIFPGLMWQVTYFFNVDPPLFWREDPIWLYVLFFQMDVSTFNHQLAKETTTERNRCCWGSQRFDCIFFPQIAWIIWFILLLSHVGKLFKPSLSSGKGVCSYTHRMLNLDVTFDTIWVCGYCMFSNFWWRDFPEV